MKKKKRDKKKNRKEIGSVYVSYTSWKFYDSERENEICVNHSSFSFS